MIRWEDTPTPRTDNERRQQLWEAVIYFACILVLLVTMVVQNG